jgi:hypothetical protein
MVWDMPGTFNLENHHKSGPRVIIQMNDLTWFCFKALNSQKLPVLSS